MQAYNVRKFHFQANICEVFAEDKQQQQGRTQGGVGGWNPLELDILQKLYYLGKGD